MSPARGSAAVVHFAPVALSIGIWTVGLSDYSYYEEFSDGEPGTWLSQLLLLVCLALLLRAVAQPQLEPAKRRVAGLLAVVAIVAFADETFMGHEAVGRFVQDHVEWLPFAYLRHTDDVIIILGAVAGGVLLWRCVRAVPDKRSYLPYLFWTILAAIAHGVLDLLGHGRELWTALLPYPSLPAIQYAKDTASYFEEACKLWTEWFVILFLLAFLYGCRRGLGWSVALFGGSFLAVAGLWVVADPAHGVPLVWVGDPLHYVRNYPVLLATSLGWIGWSLVVWVRHRGNESSRNTAALLLLSPFYVLVPQLTLPSGIALCAAATLLDRLARHRPLGARAVGVLAALQILATVGILSLQSPQLLPNYEYRPQGLERLATGRQPVGRPR